MLTISLDWLSVTFKEYNHEARAFLDTYASFPSVQTTKARHGYTDAIMDGCGTVTMWDIEYTSMGHHVQFSGSALRNIFECHGIQVDALLRSCANAGGRISRLDLAKDLSGEAIDLQAVHKSLEQGNLRGTARKYSRVTSNDGGDTIYIGSRQSEKFIRIYDKAAESKLPGELWTRFEIETKSDVARAVASLLLSTSRWTAVFDELANGMLGDLTILKLGAFYSLGEVPIGIPKITRIGDREKWISDQVIPAVAKHWVDNPNSEAVQRLIDILLLIAQQRKD